uniref:Vitellogenin receptor n=1 Tax=Acrobeloides nanus TaxID=290746 RepID=A0A914DN55_9BILA
MMTISCPKEEVVMTTAKGEDLILLLSTRKAIYQYDLSANRKMELIGNQNDIFGYAMDYWLKDSINVMDLNTKQRKVLFKDVDRPLAIAVDPSKGLIFWIGAIESNDLLGRRDRIERASMDGNDRMTIATFEDDFRVTSIALDIFNERVYWADYYTKTENDTKAIASVDYNGNDWRTILHSDTLIDPIYSLTIFEEKLYWTDRYRDGVYVINKFNGTEVRKLISGVEHPRTVRVYHSAVQPELPNKCDQHSCGDGAICLPKGNSSMGLSYSCVCADRYKRGEESNTCVLGI